MEHIPGSTPTLSGATRAQDAMAIMTIANPPTTPTQISEPECDEEGFNEPELRLAKRFIELVGGAERARELVEKVAECEECLGIVDDDDEDIIDHISSTMPTHADLPTGLYNGMGMAAQYNPSQAY